MAGCGERDWAVGFGINQTFALQSCDNARSGDVRHGKSSCEVHEAAFLVRDDDFGDCFDVVFGGFGRVVAARSPVRFVLDWSVAHFIPPIFHFACLVLAAVGTRLGFA